MGLFDLLKKGASALVGAFTHQDSPAPTAPPASPAQPNMYQGGAQDPGYTQRPNPEHNAADYQRLLADLAQQQAASRRTARSRESRSSSHAYAQISSGAADASGLSPTIWPADSVSCESRVVRASRRRTGSLDDRPEGESRARAGAQRPRASR